MEDGETTCMHKSRETRYDLNCDGNCTLHCLLLGTNISGHFIFVSQYYGNSTYIKGSAKEHHKTRVPGTLKEDNSDL
jgi:hypothetical protein